MKKISTLVLFFAIFMAMGGLVRAEQHDRLLPLLADLKGWQAQPAQGMSLHSAQMKLISANRIYNQLDKNLTVNVMINSGPVLEGDLQVSSSENDTFNIRTRQIDDFWVKSTHNKKDGSGQIIVYLDYNSEANSVLIVEYVKMGEDEAMRAVQSFDWNKFKRVVSSML